MIPEKQRYIPFFSIVIPSYNRANVIAKTIESCLEQSFGDFELLIIDDGSTDSTQAVVEAIDDPRIRYLWRINGGPAAARNSGIAAARGRYIAFLDSDDRFLPEKLQIYHDHICATGARFCYGPMYVDRGVGRMWIRPDSGMRADEGVFDYLFLRRGVFLVSTIVVESQLARQFPFDESLWYGDNDQFAVDLALAGIELHYLEEPLTIYADEYDPARLSQSPVFAADAAIHERFFDWVESHRADMSAHAYLAYRARFRSRLTARTHPAAAMRDLLSAYRARALSGKECLRQSVQTFMPNLYRRCADIVARGRGVQTPSTNPKSNRRPSP